MEWELIAEEFPSAKSGGRPRSVGGIGHFWGNHGGIAPTEFCQHQDTQDLGINRM